ncbi:DUF4163 domain-containing protein [Sphingomonas sp. DT-204]|uniref:DUF4163 domain-containing protein n=1 Tax=Sphingomonas sp. DT-204 TaxID=3396166 RepID=UPI003F1CBB55
MRANHSTILILAGLALTACGGNQSSGGNGADVADGANVVAATGSNLTAAAPAPAPSPAPAANETKLGTKDYGFTYSYPAAAAAIAPLRAWLDKDREDLRAALMKDTADARREALKGDFEYRPYDSSTVWKVVTETPRLLSLSAEIYEYTGGAHGNPGFRSLVWDKTVGRRLDPTELFSSKAAIQTAIGAAFCKRIDVERAARRGEPVVRSNDDPFSECPKVEEATLILGSSNRQAIDRVGLLVGPYVAGPYAEGSYDVTLPVTPALLRAVKPEYRGAFAVR